MNKLIVLERVKYIKHFFLAILGVLFALFFFQLNLLPKNIKFERITIADGLSQGTIYTILQDRKGFLWMGTDDGLNRYDGYNFKVYKHSPDDLNTISNNRVISLWEDNAGVLWIGTRGGGLNRFNYESDSFSRYQHDPSNPHSLSNDYVWEIYEDSKERMWIGTTNGLNEFDRSMGSFQRWDFEGENTEVIGCRQVLSLFEDKENNMWVGTKGCGLSCIYKDNNKMSDLKNTILRSGSNNNTIWGITRRNAGGFWLGTDHGIIHYNVQLKKYEMKCIQDRKFSQLKDSLVLTIYEDNSGITWVGTYGEGLFYFDEQNNYLVNLRTNPGNLNSLSSNYIQCIFEDDSGVLWVGTDAGLNKFDKKKRKFGYYEVDDDDASALSNKNVWSIFKDKKGFLWIGSEKGIDLIDRKNHQFLQNRAKRNNALRKSRIMDIHEDKEGFFWFGTSGSGLFLYSSKDDEIIQFKNDPLKPGCLSDNRVSTIYEDRNGDMWIGTANGLNRFDREENLFYVYKNISQGGGLKNDSYIAAILEDKEGALWVGTKGGLKRLDKTRSIFSHWRREPGNAETLNCDKITCIFEGNQDVLWIGTYGGGLNKYNHKDGKFRHYVEKDGLSNCMVYGILSDEKGFLWLSTNMGISRFYTKNETFKNFDARDGLQSNEFNAGAYFKSTDGELFFGGINGFNAFYPEQIKNNPHIPPIVITDFQILNEPVPIGKNSPLKKTISEVKELVLSYKHYVFSFDFAALDFSSPGKNKYAFKMEGFDNDWIHRDAAKRFATYTNLDPGEYTFRVIGSNNDGVWNKDGTSIKITIVPPFWKTTWFIVLMAVAFAVLSYLIINFVKTYIMVLGFWKRENYIGKFKLLDKIGAGGMGTIFTAQDTTQKSETVAIKVLRDELFAHRDYRKRFIQEAAIIDQLDHPNVVKVIERGQYKQKLFIVMELLKGKTLAKKIEDEKRIDLKEVFDIMIQILDALVKIHGKGIVHRDLKPENVMLIERKGNCNFVKLLDFGLAKTQFQTRITQTGAVLGTINYMSPEQVSVGDYSSSSDVYAVGAMFYESVTGLRPFCGETVTDIMKKIMNDTPTQPVALRHDIPDDINALIMEMLEKDIEKRPNVDEVLIKLKEFRSGDLLGKLDTDQTELFSDS